MTLKRGLIGALVIVLLLAGGALVYLQFFGQDAPDASQTAATPLPAEPVVVSGDGAISAEGQIVPLRHAALAFDAPGVVVEIAAAEGAPVAAGQPIVRLDDSDQQLALQRAQAALAQAQANLTAAQAGQDAAQAGVEASALGVATAEVELALAQAEPRPEEIALSEANVALAEARVVQAAAAQAVVLQGAADSRARAAEADLRAAEARAIAPRLRLEEERAREERDADALAQAERDYNAALAGIEAARVALAEVSGGATDAQRQAVAGGLTAATAQRDAAAAERDLLLAGGRTEQVAIAEAGLAGARAALAEAEAQRQATDSAAQQAAAQVAAAEAALSAAQTALDERTLTAPFAGTVADVTVAVGEVAAAGVPAAVVADFSGWLVETTDLTELDVAAVAIGVPAQARADALPDVALSGEITDIAPVAREVRGDTTYRVTIRLDDAPDAPLRWGMTVFTAIGPDATLGAPAAVVDSSAGSIAAEGLLLPQERAALAFQLGGVVAEVTAAEGQAVATGAPLMRLDATTAEAAVAQTEAALAAAEAGLAAARAGLTVAEAQQSTAATALAAAEAQLALTQAGPRPEQLAAAERNVAAAAGGVAQAAAERDAVLDVSDAAVRAAEAQLAAAQAQLTALQDAYDTILTTCVTLPDGSEVCPLLGAPEENARAQVAAAEASAAAAQLALDEARAGATAAEQRSAAAGVGVAAAQQSLAEAQRDLLLAGSRPEQIRLAEIGVERARLGVTTADVAVEQAAAAVAQAEAAVQSATADVAEARAALARLTLAAPFAGTVSELLPELGELVAPGIPVARLGGNGWVVETTDLVELDVVRVAEGQAVEVTLDALPGETLRGTVVDVGRVPEVILGDVTYRVRIALDDAPTDLPLRWGMTALVNIDVE
jgi:multidrug resistance efflux pump